MLGDAPNRRALELIDIDRGGEVFRIVQLQIEFEFEMHQEPSQGAIGRF